jgi:hypothetical protein
VEKIASGSILDTPGSGPGSLSRKRNRQNSGAPSLVRSRATRLPLRSSTEVLESSRGSILAGGSVATASILPGIPKSHSTGTTDVVVLEEKGTVVPIVVPEQKGIVEPSQEVSAVILSASFANNKLKIKFSKRFM